MNEARTGWGRIVRRAAPELGCGMAALLVRLWFLAGFRFSPLFVPFAGQHDPSLYDQAAKAVAQGHLFPAGAFEHLPLYPWVLGAVYRLFSASPLAAAGLGIACDVLTTALLVRLARRLGARPVWAAVVGLLYAAYPLAVVYSALTMPNTLQALGLTAFSLAALSTPRLTARRGAGLGLLAGGVALGFPGILPVSAAWLAVVVWREKIRARAGAAVFLAALGVPLLIPAIHNTRSEGRFVLLTTHGGFNLYMGNHEQATGHPLRVRDFRLTARAMLEDAHRFAEVSTGRPLSRAESSAWWAGQSRAFWREQPGNAFRLMLRKTALFWHGADMDDLRMREQVQIIDGRLGGWFWPGFAVFGLLGLGGLVMARAPTAKAMLLAGMAGQVLFFITARYRLPFVPLMGALGAAGLTRLLEDARARRLRPRHAALLLLGVVFWPFEFRDQRPVDHYNAALQLIAAGQMERALEVIRRGQAIDPHFALLHHAEGTVWFHRERFDEAAAAYARAGPLTAAPRNNRYNHALSLARAGRLQEALDVLDRDPAYLQADPLSARLRADLASVLAPPE